MNTTDELRKIQRNRCYLCGGELRDDSAPPEAAHACSTDHIVPRALGGWRQFPNIALAHRSCNAAKDNRPPKACEVFYGEVLSDIIGWSDVVYSMNKPKPVSWKMKNPEFESALAIALKEAGYV